MRSILGCVLGVAQLPDALKKAELVMATIRYQVSSFLEPRNRLLGVT